MSIPDINEQLPDLPDTASKYNEQFLEDMDRTLDVLPTWTTRLNNLATQIRNVKDWIASQLPFFQTVIDKANEIQGYVIPTEATYSKEEIDRKIQRVSYYDIGEPGKLGFGVGICPEQDLPPYLVPMVGTYELGHDNYGNYFHPLSGSVFVFIPKCYYKIVGNTFYYSQHPDDGYVIERAFINGGVERPGIFVSKYQGSNQGGYFASVKNADPVSTHADHNPVANINGCNENRYDELYTAAKSLGSDFFLTPIFVYSMLARMAKAHADAATSTVTCAFKDVAPYLPKGCNNNALKDTNDSSVVYEASGYSNCGKTGSASNFAKTTHNGQNCGVADLNGNMWEVASGFTRDSSDFKILKESVDIAALTEDTAYDYSNYDTIDISDLVSGNDGWIRLGNGSNQVFEFAADKNATSYKRTALSIPAASGVTSGGSINFGNDGIYRYLRSSMACLVGAYWAHGPFAGAFALALSGSRSSSSHYAGGRASVFL